MIEEIIYLLLGVAAGIVTGLLPGIHANTIAAIAIYIPAANPMHTIFFIISMSITHSFVDSIPSILLGAPSEENSINLLPGHEMLLRGKALEAIELTIFGGIITAAYSIALCAIFFSLAVNYSQFFPIIIPSVIALTIALMIANDKNKTTAIIITILSGVLGVIVLNSSAKEPVLPLVAGFFALPTLLNSYFHQNKIPPQQKTIKGKHNIEFGFTGAITSGMLAMLPGIGPSQAATIVKTITGKLDKTEYLILGGGINTGNLIFSIVMLAALSKTRTGMAVAIDQITTIESGMLPLLIGCAMMCTGIGAIATEYIARKCIDIVQKINYQKISVAALIFLLAAITSITGVIGILISFAACAIAWIGIREKTHKSHCMAFLLLPTILFYLDF